MNVRQLKAKRVEAGLRQVDLAEELGITEKTMHKKECSPLNKFKANEMLTLSRVLRLTLSEFNSIFLTATYRLFKLFKKSYQQGGRLINRFENKDGHRVCDYSDDRKTVVIVKKGCITRITANPDGTLNIENVPAA